MSQQLHFRLTIALLLALGGCATPTPPTLPDLPKTKHDAGIVVVIDNETLNRTFDFRIDKFSKYRIHLGQPLKDTADEEMPLMFSYYKHATEYREPVQGEPRITVSLTIKDFTFQPKVDAAARFVVVARAYGPNKKKLFANAYIESGTSFRSGFAFIWPTTDVDGMTRDSTRVAVKRIFGKLRADLERTLMEPLLTTRPNTSEKASTPVRPDNHKKDDLAKFNSVRVICSIPQERLIAQSDNPQSPSPYYHSPTTPSASFYPNNPVTQAHIDSAVAIGAIVMRGIMDEIRTRKAYRNAQKDIDFLQRYIGDIDYRRDFCGRLKNAVMAAGWKQIGDVVIDDKGLSEYWEDTSDESFGKLFGTGSDEALLVVHGFYRLRKPDYAVFESIIQTSLWHRTDRHKRMHAGQYAYLSETVDNETKRIAVGTWADQGGRLYRAAFKQSIDETISMIRADLLNRELPENWPTSEFQPLNMDVAGRVIRKSVDREKRVMILGPDGYYSGPRLTSEGGELESIATALERIRQNARASGAQ